MGGDANQNHAPKHDLIILYLFKEGAGNEVHDMSQLRPTADLYIPDIIYRGITPQQKFLSPLVFHNILDIVLNIILFVPFGLLYYANVRKRNTSSFQSFIIVLLSGLLFSFCMESIQALLITRYSHLTDILANSLGMIIGMVLAQKFAIKGSCKTLNQS